MSKSAYPLKLPASVKAAAGRLAKADGVSLNQSSPWLWPKRLASSRRPRSSWNAVRGRPRLVIY